MTSRDVNEAAAHYRATYDTALSELLSRIWGGNLHLGLFSNPDEALPQAQLRANHHMAAASRCQAGQVVVEAACGVGSTARYLAENYGVRVRATNIAESQLTEARELTERAGLGHLVDFSFADYHELPFADASFDVWWCQEALLYAVDKRRVLEEAIRVVRPSGRLIMSDLLLGDGVAGSEREDFTSKLKAPHMWSMGHWDRLIAGLPVCVAERHDWGAHAAPTFRNVLANFEGVRDEFTGRLGTAAMEAARERLSIQYEFAQAGKLSWCFYALVR
ncbi:MAG: methyltransferase domain-containing protein [Hyphomicrobiales bacterium]|nr:methyltransferase domain-containing protein [Acidobacteriaceae bacterium]MBV9755025.1 methyltransferase domain-containing protein [Hyphomicrobiales bacterium]